MPFRTTPFVNDQYYHIYNRGTEKRHIFENRHDYHRFLQTINYYQIEGPKPKFSHFPSLLVSELDISKKIVEIVAFCLMPNHFHLLIKQTKENGITEFVGKLSNSYTKYYNAKYNRAGPLFQGEFKAVLVESNEQLLHLSRYIHLNPLISYLVKKLNQYEWSSYQEYIGDSFSNNCAKDVILSFYKQPKDYKQFVMDQISYAQELECIKHQLIDVED